MVVRRQGTPIRIEYLDVRAMATTRAEPRVGFVVPKYKHSSVDRNRLKRQLRELVRTRLMPTLRGVPCDGSAVGLDVVVRALPAAYGVDWPELEAQIDRLRTAVMRRVRSSDR
jgi:ribonuclease P protein component